MIGDAAGGAANAKQIADSSLFRDLFDVLSGGNEQNRRAREATIALLSNLGQKAKRVLV